MAGERTEDYACDGCGLDYAGLGPGEVAPLARKAAPRWRDLTTEPDHNALTTRPTEGVWSAHEYGWHLGTVLAWMAVAIERMTEEDRPSFDWFGQDEDVERHDPNGRALDEITTRIDAGSAHLAAVLETVDLDAWDREAEFTWGTRDVLDMARNAVHEGEHHLHDVEHVLDEVRQHA